MPEIIYSIKLPGIPNFYKLETVYQEAELLRVLLNYWDETLTTEEGEAFLLIDFMIAELENYEFADRILETLKNELFTAYVQEGMRSRSASAIIGRSC